MLRLGKSESTPKHSPENIDRANTPGTIGTPIALPPRFDNEPLRPGQARPEIMPNGLSALSPMKGLNYDTLFAEKIKDSGSRFGRVENAVLDLRKEFETYKPAIVRLSAVESDIQNLIKELEVLLQETPTTQHPPLDLTEGIGSEDDLLPEDALLDVRQLNPQPTPPPDIYEPPPTQKSSAPPPAKASSRHGSVDRTNNNGHVVATNFRIGEHDNMLRVAFDTNEDTPFTIELDNDENLIIVELPQASWDGKRDKSFPDSALLDTLSVEPINGEKGSMVILSLKKDTQILQRKHLSPDKTTHYHRVYFDLKL
ncbi:MAG: hypothetical protein KAJ40_03160 [Alphaproteobacteria bacterium]|nr:hypothetical protein [Alphaproteobacteria bacterium]